MSHEKVTRLRQLMQEAVPVQKHHAIAAKSSHRAAQIHEINSLPPSMHRTWQSITIRKINRIAVWHALATELESALHAAGVNAAEELSDIQLVNLHARLLQVEENYYHSAETAPRATPKESRSASAFTAMPPPQAAKQA